MTGCRAGPPLAIASCVQPSLSVEIAQVRDGLRVLGRRTSRLRRQFWCVVAVVAGADVAAVVDYLRLLRTPGPWLLVAWVAMLGVMVAGVIIASLVERQLVDVSRETRRLLSGFFSAPHAGRRS